MEYLVFSQEKTPRLPLVRLLQNAKNYFGLSVTVLGEEGVSERGEVAEASRVLLELENPKHGYTARFEISARYASVQDQSAAREAESAGRAAGMADLARRCPTVWEVTAAPLAPELSTFELCAVLASTALGPVLPRDASTLFGVRGALERAKRASAIG